MSKHYLPLITLLLLLALTVGSFAFYRSVSSPTKQYEQISLATPTVLPSQTPTPTGTIAGANTASISANKIALTITSPTTEASVSSSLLPISGKTATSAAVKINDRQLEADLDGNFRTSIRLTEGPNLLTIIASSAGQSTIWQTVVTYFPKETTLPTPVPTNEL